MKRFCSVMFMIALVSGLLCVTTGVAQAEPHFGSTCSNCHQASGGALTIQPSSSINVMPGGNAQVTFDVTDIPVTDAAIALTGLDDPDLGATVGAGWVFKPTNLYASDPYLEATGPQTLDLAIDAGAMTGSYLIDVQFAGGPSVWHMDPQRFTINVIPEPASLALVLSGLGLLGLIRWRRRR